MLGAEVLAAAAVGRVVYRFVRSFEETDVVGEPLEQPLPIRRQQTEAPVIPDLDMPEGAMKQLGAQGVLLLSDGLLQQLAQWLPRRHTHARWTMLFSTGLDGYSLHTLYRKCTDRGVLLLLVRDVHGGLFGAHIADRLRLPDSGHATGTTALATDSMLSFYGTGETFLFEVLPMGHLPPLLDGSAPPPVSVCAYRWSHKDDLFVTSTHEFVAIGGGGARYGLRLESDLQSGRSGVSLTFNNPPLGSTPNSPGASPLPKLRASGPSAAHDGAAVGRAVSAAAAGAQPAVAADEDSESRWFDVSAVEVWSLDDWTLHHHHELTPFGFSVQS